VFVFEGEQVESALERLTDERPYPLGLGPVASGRRRAAADRT
jgi:hypothetical protein